MSHWNTLLSEMGKKQDHHSSSSSNSLVVDHQSQSPRNSVRKRLLSNRVVKITFVFCLKTKNNVECLGTPKNGQKISSFPEILNVIAPLQSLPPSTPKKRQLVEKSSKFLTWILCSAFLLPSIHPFVVADSPSKRACTSADCQPRQQLQQHEDLSMVITYFLFDINNNNDE